jgi:hypothetical protein
MIFLRALAFLFPEGPATACRARDCHWPAIYLIDKTGDIVYTHFGGFGACWLSRVNFGPALA